ncbi:anthrone oxygenase family protein [Nocardiopsis sediminis]|uniref:Anthrone oxygenase family protein n=1 Tax=Nocardiopsis sediminis TaxID=1778267 RepID=A0ABV8FRT0_9ACTN
MLVQALGIVAIIGSGIVAGVFFAVAVSVLPTLTALPMGTYIPLHKELGKGYHPSMPLIVGAAVLADIGLVVVAPGTPVRVLSAAALLALVGVQIVSQFGNVPINRRVNAVDPESVPADWPDPRPLWRGWHRLRTAFALLALVANAAAVALAAAP